MNLVPIKRALLSVSDKSGIVEFARVLKRWNVEILSTGGTLSCLRAAGIDALSITEITNMPELFDGRVKTLHPKILGGLLAINGNPIHRQQLDEFGIVPIDMVVVNLYPFEQTIAREHVSLNDAVEQIDIGGPTMIRSAAKNYHDKTVVVQPSQYDAIAGELERHNGSISEQTRLHLAREAFFHTSQYDAIISQYVAAQFDERSENSLPDILTVSLSKSSDLRYGENSHQHAALYGSFHTMFEPLHGKELSYNNIVDISSAAELTEEFSDPTVAIIKHTNPCGVGSGASLTDAYEKALATDTTSAFGGIVAANKTLDMDTAHRIDKLFTEVIVAPEYAEGVLDFLKRKKDRRLIRQRQHIRQRKSLMLKNVPGGILAQTADDITSDPGKIKVVTKRSPSENEQVAMMFAWKVAKHVKSNAIVYTREDRTIGIGAGQMSRVDAARIAVLKANDAGLELKGTAVASDAFFPFADGLLEAVHAGATAVIQPGGSVRDNEVIAAADANNIAMIFTGIRHFKH